MCMSTTGTRARAASRARSGSASAVTSLRIRAPAAKAARATAGLAVSIPCYAAYNYLVSRVNGIVLDMEKAATEIANILADV